jgi:hypothetical protein
MVGHMTKNTKNAYSAAYILLAPTLPSLTRLSYYEGESHGRGEICIGRVD